LCALIGIVVLTCLTANTAITKNITKIKNLKESVDIDGKGSDVDLTHLGLELL
jgi:hypothetical protein